MAIRNPNRAARGKGSRAEGLLLRQLTEAGYEARRTHLSLFPDIIAWNETEILLIEVKARANKPRAVSDALSKFRSSVKMMTTVPNSAIVLCYLMVNNHWSAYKWQNGTTERVSLVINEERYGEENESK